MSKTKLTDMKITHVSYVKKGANKKQFFLMKSDEDSNFEREIQVFVNKADKEKKLVYGVVYEPDTLDTQGEFASDAEIEKAAHEFLADSRNIDLQHNFKSEYGTVVESYIAPVDFKIGDINIKKGSWTLVTKANDDVWESIKKGEVTGYSMAGKATKTEVEELEKQTLEASDDEYKGFFNVIKEFFSKSKIEKATKEVSTLKGFAQRMAVADVMENMWRVTDSLNSTMCDILADKEISNKQEGLNKAIDEFAVYMKKKVSKVDESVTKADIDFFNFKSIKEDKTKGEDDMKAEEITEVVKKAMVEVIKPINDKLDTFEKQDSTNETTDTDIQEAIKKAVAEALEPISQRMANIEKAKGVSRQEQEEKPVKKSTSVFAGLDI